MVCRLQRVTLLALHQYLGLGSELIAAKHRGSKNIKGRQQHNFPTLKNIFTEDLMSTDYHPNCRDGMESGGFLCIFFAHVADYVTYVVPSLHTVRIVFRSPYILYF